MSYASRASSALSVPIVGALLLLAAGAQAADVAVTLGIGDGFSIRNNTGAIERLRVNEATGNVSRNGALFIHTTGSTTSTFVGALAGSLATTGTRNSAFGDRALSSNTTGQQNDAFGHLALRANTTGIRNSAFGAYALSNNTTGNDNAGFGNAALYRNTTGIENAAFGEEALANNTAGNTNSAFGTAALRGNIGGSRNSAFGRTALVFNSSGSNNSAFGADALRYNTISFDNSAFGNLALRSNIGGQNSAFGNQALHSNTTASGNAAFGNLALRSNTTGSGNSAFGQVALYRNTTGFGNIALGDGAGYNQTTGDNNIYIGNAGVAGEDGLIRIGTQGTHVRAWIQGIHGVVFANATSVVIREDGLLGVPVSSARFKRDVRDMGDASELLMKLRPVAFRYRKEVVADGEHADDQQYGLIAEEVVEVAPELVTRDDEGKPYSVQYQDLPVLLLNEMQKERQVMEEQARLNDAQQRTIEALRGRLAELEKQSSANVAAR